MMFCLHAMKATTSILAEKFWYVAQRINRGTQLATRRFQAIIYEDWKIN